MKIYKSLEEALEDLRKRGYEADFTTGTICLYCGDLDMRLYPGEFNIDEVYRFIGNSNSGDNAFVYAITTSGGLKGILVDSIEEQSERLSWGIAKKFEDYHEMNYQIIVSNKKRA